MTQLDLIDPRTVASVTRAMHADPYLKDSIKWVRSDWRRSFTWPYVEALVEHEGRQVWLIDDAGMQYIVLGSIVFLRTDLRLVDEKIRKPAKAAFARIDAIGRVS